MLQYLAKRPKKNRDQIRNLEYNLEIIPSSRFLDRISEKIDANIDVTQKTTKQKLKERESWDRFMPPTHDYDFRVFVYFQSLKPNKYSKIKHT